MPHVTLLPDFAQLSKVLDPCRTPRATSSDNPWAPSNHTTRSAKAFSEGWSLSHRLDLAHRVEDPRP